MNNKITGLILIFLVLFVSCEKDDQEQQNELKEGLGTVWLSGGLYYCAEQIRMNEGDTLIINDIETIYQFKSEDKVNLKYYETELHELGCTIGKNCDIIEIEKID